MAKLSGEALLEFKTERRRTSVKGALCTVEYVLKPVIFTGKFTTLDYIYRFPKGDTYFSRESVYTSEELDSLRRIGKVACLEEPIFVMYGSMLWVNKRGEIFKAESREETKKYKGTLLGHLDLLKT